MKRPPVSESGGAKRVQMGLRQRSSEVRNARPNKKHQPLQVGAFWPLVTGEAAVTARSHAQSKSYSTLTVPRFHYTMRLPR